MIEFEKYQNKLQKEISNKSSFMNSTKWKYLFSIMRSDDFTYCAKVKLLLDEEIRDFHIPDTSDFINEKYLEEVWGVFELKEIEWILIPNQISYERKNRTEILTPKVEVQDIKKLERQLKTGKKIEFEVNEEGLIIYGYK